MLNPGRGELTSCLGESSSCKSQPGAVNGEDRDTCHDVQGVWMDIMLADMRVEATEDLHGPESRYTILLIFFYLSDTP